MPGVGQLTPAVTTPCLPALVAAAGERASVRFLEFFAAAIRNPYTRRAYARAAADFLAWCEDHGVHPVTAVQPRTLRPGLNCRPASRRRRRPTGSGGPPHCDGEGLYHFVKRRLRETQHLGLA